MFGIVPKALWSKELTSDRENRVLLGNNSLLVESKNENILIDLGLGDKYDEKAQDIYGIKQGPTLMDALEEVGKIDRIILTHLHFDHIGWITQKHSDGQIRLTFPESEIIVQKREWEAANNPDELNRASYLPENITPLAGSDNLHLVDGDMEISPGIEVILTGGHSAGHQIVKITSAGKTALFWGDILPTTHHLRLAYISAYDIDPHTTLSWKKKFLPLAEREGWVNIFEHNPRRPMGRIELEDPEKKKYHLLDRTVPAG
jgi:glyoxylase-like metal-dependent hydrolase (beta-lactamase superfamily II)